MTDRSAPISLHRQQYWIGLIGLLATCTLGAQIIMAVQIIERNFGGFRDVELMGPVTGTLTLDMGDGTAVTHSFEAADPVRHVVVWRRVPLFLVGLLSLAGGAVGLILWVALRRRIRLMDNQARFRLVVLAWAGVPICLLMSVVYNAIG